MNSVAHQSNHQLIYCHWEQKNGHFVEMNRLHFEMYNRLAVQRTRNNKKNQYAKTSISDDAMCVYDKLIQFNRQFSELVR